MIGANNTKEIGKGVDKVGFRHTYIYINLLLG